MLSLALGDLSPIDEAWDAAPSRRGPLAGPIFARGEVTLDSVEDLFLETTAWGKGVAWINGFNLGRFWVRGPQRTLYVPSPILRAGRNEVVILELHAASGSIRFAPRADLGHIDY